ncbi:DUF808 family protein [Pseudomonas aeruginosa]|uniref:histidine kinase n=20 Tax=Pseudomonadota TaxID=1224 RepID=A0A367MEG3_PSEAI|nr:DUF808 family protein [Pseudomonas aeruginosa]
MAGASLLTLLDDIAAVLDDVSLMTKVAAKKTAGVLGDDLALNAQQVTGVNADRELPVVWAVAKGSLRNKAILVPAALLISAFAPWAVIPLLMLGGAYLCFEGFEKIAHKYLPHDDEHADEAALAANVDVAALEKQKIGGAIRTDFILSAEIIAITLGTVAESSFTTQVLVLVGIALLVWGRPHWRDLETLRLAAQRFGDGDLSSRTRIFRRSDIRTLAQHFNQMADRIESLISNQRELTNAVSHELRTPISRLSFELEQLNKQVDAEVRHDLIEDMRADLGELEEMVSELLTYARLEHGNVGSHREIVDAASWLDSVVADVALEAEAAGVTCEISACQVEQIRIEPRFMARAVINLLRNAIRHAHSRVEIALLDQGDSCQIRVNDDGPGIPADARQKIFEPFSRLDDSRDRSTGGFGLGLAIVRRVAQWHGGYAEALETPQGGASFRLTWERPR